DNVGDNVGDVAGMGADLFESYVGAIVSSMILGMSWYVGITKHQGFDGMNAIYLPMVVGLVGILASIVGTFFVRTKEGGNPQAALNFGTVVAGVIMIAGTVAALAFMLPRDGVIEASNVITGKPDHFYWWGLAVAVIGGLLCGMAIGFVTEYYTATHKKPVEGLVDSARTGPATAVIQGLALGMNSTTIPVILICAAILLAYMMAGLYGVALAAVGMLSTTGIQLAVDAYGPIADNSGGIAEMSKLGRDVRTRTDSLDAVGNTTAAIGKGFAIGSAALTALAMTAAYITKIGESGHSLNLNASEPYVLVGLLIGCALPFRFSAMAMVAVGKAAQDMIQEVRRQFREIPELRPALIAAQKAEADEREPNAQEQAVIDAADGKADYAHCVSIATAAAIKKMVVPGLLAVVVPLAVGIFSLEMLGGLLVGCTISGVCLAIFQSNAGGAWDNSKKQVKEGGHKVYGEAYDGMHKATVTCDTVGDPLKDTSGPSLNILIKLVSVVAMIIVPILMWIHS
ncbi:MAG: sodium/proton-translocating pyrophosphatase, partial [Deltaproteobacteria bacterium]|nr:sodium/proton-translocating pyrophosphatase [Deltaproteobacteria bacterium]